jgi:hypothetical protein
VHLRAAVGQLPSRHGISPVVVEAELGVAGGAQHGAERVAVTLVRPGDQPAFQLADVVGVDGRLLLEQPPVRRTHRLGELLLSEPAGPARGRQQPVRGAAHHVPGHRPPAASATVAKWKFSSPADLLRVRSTVFGSS